MRKSRYAKPRYVGTRCTVHVALPLRPLNQLNPVQQNGQHALEGKLSYIYCDSSDELFKRCHNGRETGIIPMSKQQSNNRK